MLLFVAIFVESLIIFTSRVRPSQGSVNALVRIRINNDACPSEILEHRAANVLRARLWVRSLPDAYHHPAGVNEQYPGKSRSWLNVDIFMRHLSIKIGWRNGYVDKFGEVVKMTCSPPAEIAWNIFKQHALSADSSLENDVDEERQLVWLVVGNRPSGYKKRVIVLGCVKLSGANAPHVDYFQSPLQMNLTINHLSQWESECPLYALV